ncbi:MAG: FtsX-like permease family protein, partial [Promethearchaeota archaeon]
MNFRLFKKSIMLSMRSKRRFTVFTISYTILIVWMSYSIQQLGRSPQDNKSVMLLVVAFTASILLSILYAWIIINYRKMEIATLKTIGYTNNNIRTIILGELIWVTLVSFFIVSEFLIHYLAIDAYYMFMNNRAQDIAPFINIPNLLITVGLFMVAQIAGILLAYKKILKLRPIIA